VKQKQTKKSERECMFLCGRKATMKIGKIEMCDRCANAPNAVGEADQQVDCRKWPSVGGPVEPILRGPVKGTEKPATFDESWQPETSTNQVCSIKSAGEQPMAENNGSVGQQKQPSFRIKTLTVSVEIADKQYGDGNTGYSSITATVDDASLEHIENVIDAGLNLFVAAWENVIGGKVATKMLGMGAQEFRDAVATVQRRAAKVRALLHDGNTNYEKKEEVVIEVGE